MTSGVQIVGRKENPERFVLVGVQPRVLFPHGKRLVDGKQRLGPYRAYHCRGFYDSIIIFAKTAPDWMSTPRIAAVVRHGVCLGADFFLPSLCLLNVNRLGFGFGTVRSRSVLRGVRFGPALGSSLEFGSVFVRFGTVRFRSVLVRFYFGWDRFGSCIRLCFGSIQCGVHLCKPWWPNGRRRRGWFPVAIAGEGYPSVTLS